MKSMRTFFSMVLLKFLCFITQSVCMCIRKPSVHPIFKKSSARWWHVNCYFSIMIREASLKIHLKKQFKMCYCMFQVQYHLEIDFEDFYLRHVWTQIIVWHRGINGYWMQLRQLAAGGRDRAHVGSLSSNFFPPFSLPPLLSSCPSLLPFLHISNAQKGKVLQKVGVLI